MKSALFLMLPLVLFSFPSIAQTTLEDVLRQYADNQAKLSSIHTRYEGTTMSLPRRDQVTRATGEFFSDGRRFCRREHTWPDYKPTTQCDQGRLLLFDGERRFQYTWSYERSTVPGSLVISKPALHPIAWYADAEFLLGFDFHLGHQTQRVDEAIRSASRTLLHPGREWVNGASCVVVEAKWPDAECKVWFDPDRGYNIVRGIAKATFRPTERARVRRWNREYTNIRLARVGDAWVPMEGDLIGDARDLEFYFVPRAQWVHHIKRTHVQLNPDFAALGAFEPWDVRDGSRVAIVEEKGKWYRWRAGQLIPDGP